MRQRPVTARPTATPSRTVRTARSFPIRCVVFDLDGTLVDTMSLAPQAYADAIRQLNGPAVSTDDVVAAWHIGPTRVVLGHFLGRPATAADEELFDSCLGAAVPDVRPFPGVEGMLRALRDSGVSLGVFTSATRRTTDLVLRSTRLDSMFTVIQCGDEVDEPKPSPRGLLMLCERLGLVASDTAYVGDAEVDMLCAKRAGAVPIHAAWGCPGTARETDNVRAHTPMAVLTLARLDWLPWERATRTHAAGSVPSQVDLGA